MPVRWTLAAILALLLLAAGCTKKPAPVPTPPLPQQPQNIFALLPDPDGRTTGIVVRNPAGEQEISQPDQAVRVPGATVAPTAPFAIDQPTVRRLFGTALNALPSAEVHFVLYFDLAQDALNAQSQAQIPLILRAIQDRRSTNISVTGHTDTYGPQNLNYGLGLRRAETVATILRADGVVQSNLFVTSHGEADPLIKTARGVDEPQNRRVEVIVR
jgi:outer membrane protein OmpA-like peptidoglycan-associated protein